MPLIFVVPFNCDKTPFLLLISFNVNVPPLTSTPPFQVSPESKVTSPLPITVINELEFNFTVASSSIVPSDTSKIVEFEPEPTVKVPPEILSPALFNSNFEDVISTLPPV